MNNWLALLVAVIGAIVMWVNLKTSPPNNYWARIGEIMFFCGLLAFLLANPVLSALGVQ